MLRAGQRLVRPLNCGVIPVFELTDDTKMATTLKETLAQLEALGNEKVRAQNSKNGAGDNQFGVRLGDIRKLATKIKTNHALAIALWETGNIDARLLAILLINPKNLSGDELDRMVRSVGFVQVAVAQLLRRQGIPRQRDSPPKMDG